MAPRSLPLPPGVYTVLPQVNACDIVTLPHGPWDDNSCRFRLEQHNRTDHRGPTTTANNNNNDSVFEDEEDDETTTTAGHADGDGRLPTAAELDAEFLVPFFVELPPPAPGTTSTPSASSHHHHQGRPTSRTTSFSRMTPLPSLRSSSPTPSYPAPLPPRPQNSSTTPPQPIGFLRPAIVQALIQDNVRMINMACRPVWAFRPPVAIPAPPPRPSSRKSSYSSRRGSHSILQPMTSGSGPGTPSESQQQQQPGEGVKLEDVLEGLRVSGEGNKDGKGTYAVGFEEWVNEEGSEARKEHIDRLVRGWKELGMFSDALNGWRDEHYAIYGPAPPFVQSSPSSCSSSSPPKHTSNGADDEEEEEYESNPLPGSNVAFSMERAACALFGVATFGVHATVYIEKEGEPLKMWVPRRSATKQTWPLKLDNTVAGGITSGDSPFESIIRECTEEASLSPAFVEEHIRSTSLLSYTYRTETGWIQPELQYCYDLKLPSDGTGETPRINDGEVESFTLMDLEEVVERMVKGEFKPNCALVLIDFFLRHGYLTPESDARFLEVATRMRRGLVLPGPA